MSALHWVALSRADGLSRAQARQLAEQLGSAEAIWKADADLLASLSGLPKERFVALHKLSLDEIAQELESLRREGIAVLTPDDAEYPILLRDLRDAPAVLYMRGSLETRDQWAVAIVGSRLADPGSGDAKMAWTHELAKTLAEWGSRS
jgi:DNA processing protein